MEGEQNLGSDSDSDNNNDNTVDLASRRGTNRDGITYVKEIEKLKLKTNDLLDISWKESRNKELLKKMLSLDDPVITPKMIDFLLQDGVMETLLGFVTQINGGPRPSAASVASAEPNEALILSYKTTVLLTAEVPSNELLSVLGRKVAVITRASFDIFRPESSGSFYHAYRLIDCLLRCYPAEFYDAVCSDGRLYDRMASLLHYIGYAPVPDIFVCIVTLAPIARSNALFTLSSKNRWTFFEGLSDWNMMLRVAEVVVRPKEFCCLKDNISLEEHSSCAAQLLQELSEKLSLEDTGELLLQPLGYTPEILDYLVFTGVNPNIVEPIRRASLKLLCFLLKRSADPELLCMVSTPGREQPTPMCVPNRMHHLRPLMVEHLAAIVGEVFRILINYDSSDGLTQEKKEQLAKSDVTKHMGYVVARPFTTMRLLLIEFAVCMVEASDSIALSIPTECWTVLMTWVLRYAYNNIFHAYFYRLLFAILRQGNEEVLHTMFVKARLLTFLLELYSEFPTSEAELLPKIVTQELRSKDVCRGLVLNCLNAIRLQASSQAPNSFLREFLTLHEQWDAYVHPLESVTKKYQKEFGFGLRILDGNGKQVEINASSNHSLLSGLSFGGSNNDSDCISLGSAYATSLGFGDEIAWPDSAAEKRRMKERKMKFRANRSRTNSTSSDVSTDSTISSVSNASMTSGVGVDGAISDEDARFIEDDSAVVPTPRNSLGCVLVSTLEYFERVAKPSESEASASSKGCKPGLELETEVKLDSSSEPVTESLAEPQTVELQSESETKTEPTPERESGDMPDSNEQEQEVPGAAEVNADMDEVAENDVSETANENKGELEVALQEMTIAPSEAAIQVAAATVETETHAISQEEDVPEEKTEVGGEPSRESDVEETVEVDSA